MTLLILNSNKVKISFLHTTYSNNMVIHLWNPQLFFFRIRNLFFRIWFTNSFEQNYRRIFRGATKCPECNKSFSTSTNCKRHFDNAHKPASKLYRCLLCTYRCGPYANMKRHMQSHAEGRVLDSSQYSYECKTCGEFFADRRSRWKHNKNHLETSQWVCVVCKAHFLSEARLTVHLRKTECKGMTRHIGILRVHW